MKTGRPPKPEQRKGTFLKLRVTDAMYDALCRLTRQRGAKYVATTARDILAAGLLVVPPSDLQPR